MNKGLGFLGGLTLCFFLAAPFCQAASGDADGTYTVTITKIELSTDGTNFVTIFSGSSSINIASVTAGAQAAGLVSGKSVPPGTYATVRTTLGATLQLKGFRTISGDTWYTDGGTDTGAFTQRVGVTDSPGSDYTTATFTIPAASRTTSFSVNFTIPEGGAASTVSITFDTSGVITNNGGTPSVGAPTITITVA